MNNNESLRPGGGPTDAQGGTGSSFIGVDNHTLLDKSLRAATTTSLKKEKKNEKNENIREWKK